MPASGLQIAFLMFAVQFFAMLLARALQPHLAWAESNFLLLANLVAFGVGAALLFGIPSLRRHCLALLAKPAHLSPAEVAAALVTKAAIPFALVGIAVLATALTGDLAYAQATKRHVDAQTAWQWLLSPPGLAQTVLLAWLIGPVIEEIVFRGLLQPAFEARWGWARATIVNAILFGAIHPTHMAAAAIGSVVMACVWRRTGSLRDCIVVHIGYNIVISWPLLGQWLLAPPTGPFHELVHWLPHLVALAAAAVALPAWVVWSARAAAVEPDKAVLRVPFTASPR